jgi:hypothetical protein
MRNLMSKLWFWRRRQTMPRPRPGRSLLSLEALEDRTLPSGTNPIVTENQLAGTAPSVWNVGPGNDTIDGYTTDISYQAGSTVNFKINTPSTNYLINIYRMGYYQGNGARLVASENIVLPSRQVQPAAENDPTTGLNDYGTWNVSASWTIPTTAVSGIYFADLIRQDGVQDHSMVYWIVRNDGRTSDIAYLTSDTTWEAYNEYGGASLYTGNAGFSSTYNSGYSYAVSYNRPFTDEEVAGGFGTWTFLFHAEYPMVRWLEANGYDVSYLAHEDLDRSPGILFSHHVVMDSGHDEYWSGPEVAAMQQAENAGINAAFFSGNEVYWKTRWQNSIDGSNTPYRTLVTYKESFAGNPDPATPPTWTGTWMDPKGAAPNDAYLPSNAVTGTLFEVNRGAANLGGPLTVPSVDSRFLFWSNTAVATLSPGQQITLGDYELGYEWDVDADNGFRPAGLIDLSSTTQTAQQVAQDAAGITFAVGTATNSQTLFRNPSGALVFGAGTVQWSWGLDSNHDDGPAVVVPAIQQATVNLFAMMGVQPTTLMTGLVPGPTTFDPTPPVSAISSLGGFPYMQTAGLYTITGTATDAGGGIVAGVEVSTDSGKTWHPASPVGNNWSNWSYTWSPTTAGTTTIETRGVNDSVYLETPSDQVNVTVLAGNVTAPQAAAISATPIGLVSASVSWTTDKLSTSQVNYGLTPQNLNLSVSNSTPEIPHSLTLTGLTSNTTYYYQVVSVDSYGNSVTAPATPASFTTPAFFDSSATFAAGTLANTAVSQSGVILPPGLDYEFAGTSLPAGWTSSLLASQGYVSVNNNMMTLDGAQAQTTSGIAAGQSLQFTATFGGAPEQHVGLASNLTNGPWAIFSTGAAGNALYARTFVNGVATDTLLSGSFLVGAPHQFRIDWTTTSIKYWIDGVLAVSHAATIAVPMSLVASDGTYGTGNIIEVIQTDEGTTTITVGSNINVNWMRVAPYGTFGTYTSQIVDAGTQVTWGSLVSSSAAPASTSLALAVRMGNTPVPDSTWTDFIPLSDFGSTIGTYSRYLQYQATLSTSDPNQTPSLGSVGITYSTGLNTVPPIIVSRTPAAGATAGNFSPAIVVEFSDLMNQASVNANTFYLQATGTNTNVAATVSFTAGSTAVLQPTVLLAANTSYTVTVSGSVTDGSGRPLGANVSWSFLTPLYSSVADTGVANFNSGTPGPGTLVTPVGVRLAPTVWSDFTGATLPAGWTVTPWASGGTGTVGSGGLLVDGARAGTTAFYGPGSSLDFMATFSGDPAQHVGFGIDFNSAPWAMFSTGAGGGNLYARINDGIMTNDVPLGSQWLGSPHEFRINWTSMGMVYFIDGMQVANIALALHTNMHLLASDFTVGGGKVTINWMSLTPYTPSGTFQSRVFDVGQSVTWSSLAWNSTTPAGTSLIVSVRMGNTPTPDASWTSYVPLAGSGATIGGVSRYLQYQVFLTTSDTTQTPQLASVTVTYTVSADTVAPSVVGVSPTPGSTGANFATPVFVSFSELMNPATLNTATVRIRPVGGSSDLPATVSYAGSTATLQPLADLNGNTTYQVTVSGTVTDSTGNALGTDYVSTFTTAPLSFTDVMGSDFNGGTPGPNTFVRQDTSGAVTLAPTAGLSPLGTSLPAGWFSTPWTTGGAATVASGLLTVDGARVGTNSVYGSGNSLEFVGTFTGDPGQHAGFGVDFNSAPWAMFSTFGGGSLYARVNNGYTSQDIALGSQWLGSPHDYRIDWSASGVTFSIDGNQVANVALNIGGTMRPLVSDANVGGGVITVNWMALTPYVASGTFQSRVFDAGQTVTWSTLSWTATTPAGTGLTVSVRMGNTPTPDGTWTNFAPLAGSGATIGGTSRYLQYQVSLTTTAPGQTPVFQDAILTFSLSSNTSAPVIVGESPAPGATNVSITAPITVSFNEFMNAATLNTTTLQLQAVGGSAVAVQVSYAGSTATLQPLAPLIAATQYQASVAGSVTDASGNALGSTFTWTFTTQVIGITDTGVNDFGAGTTGPNTYISQMADGEVILAPTVGSEFSGTALPTGWYSTPWSSGGAATVAGGLLTLDGSRAGSSALYGPGSSLQFSATFSGDQGQHVGLGVDFASAPWAIFSTFGGGNLYARVNNGTTTIDTPLAGNWLGAAHLFRIDWTATGVTFWIDGNQVASDAIAIAASMGPLASDANVGGGTVKVDWMHLSPYAASGTFQSRIFDGGSSATWNTISWDSQTPAGTGLTMSVRTGNTPTPDGTWTPFTQVSGSGASIGTVARYFQYQASLTTTDPTQTPVLQDVTITYLNNSLVALPGTVNTTEGSGVNGNLASAQGSTSSLTYAVVNGPANGSVVITNSSTGAFTYTPNTEFYGTDSFTFQASGSGLVSNIATETVNVNAINDAPTANAFAVTLPDSGVAAVALSGSDEETAAANLIFTVTSLPTAGNLFRANGTPVHVGDTFTGSPTTLTYQLQFAYGNVTDSFTYTVKDTGAPAGNTSNALTSAPATATITTPANSNGIVRVGGTSGADNITVAPTGGGQFLQVTLNGQVLTNSIALASITGIRIYGQGGNDAIQLTDQGIPSYVATGTGNSTITLTGPSGAATIAGGTGLNTLAITDNTNYTLTNTSLTTADGTNLTLSGIGAANLTGGSGNNSFDVSGWTGAGTIAGGGGTDTISATKNQSFTLTNTSLTATDGLNLTLSGIAVANLSGGIGNNTFDLSGWTGGATLVGGGGTDIVSATKNQNFTLTNTSLTATDGLNVSLSGISTANLTGGTGNNSFTLTGWTGSGSLVGGGGTDTVLATKNANFTLSNTSLAASDGSNFTLSGIAVASLTAGTGGYSFTVSGWTGSGTLTGSGASISATKNASFTLTNTSLSASDGASLTLSGITTANLAAGIGAYTFTVSGWTGTGSLTGGGSDAVNATKNVSFTLTNSALTATDGTNLTLSGIAVANLTGGAGSNTFTVSGWSGGGSLTGGGGAAIVSATKNQSFTLSNTSLSATDGMSLSLSGIAVANLTAGNGTYNIAVSGWTGTGTLTGSGSDSVSATKNQNFTLTNTSLTATDGANLTLAGIAAANLTGGAGNNTFTVSGWTGTGTVTGGGGTDTISATKNQNFTLSNTSLTATDGLSVTLSGISVANLTGGTGNNSFDVSGWTGTGAITGGGGTDTISATKNQNFTLTNTSLSASDGANLSLAGIATANLTGGVGNNTFTVSGWTGGGKLTGGGGTDTVSATKNQSFTLTNTSLSATDGLSLTLSGIAVANLTGGTGNNTFTVSGWTGGGTITGGGGTNTVSATKNANFTLTNTSLSAGDGSNLTLSGIAVANLTAGSGSYSIDVSGWTGTGTLTGSGTDMVTATKNASFTLTNSSLNTTDGMKLTLSNIQQAVLESGTSTSTIDASAFSGTATLAAGSGNDTLKGGSGNDILLGGAGNDTITATGNGRNLLLAGSGTSTLTGGNGDDILIGGTMSYYNQSTGAINSVALNAIMAEWTSSKSYATRISDLQNGGGLNGSYVLNNTTVGTGSGHDTLTGSGGTDWFQYTSGDKITDLAKGETKTQIGAKNSAMASRAPSPPLVNVSADGPIATAGGAQHLDAAAVDALMTAWDGVYDNNGPVAGIHKSQTAGHGS